VYLNDDNKAQEELSQTNEIFDIILTHERMKKKLNCHLARLSWHEAVCGEGRGEAGEKAKYVHGSTRTKSIGRYKLLRRTNEIPNGIKRSRHSRTRLEEKISGEKLRKSETKLRKSEMRRRQD
jgi:hypothetical protein